MGIETAIIGSAILGAGASAYGASKQAKAAKTAQSAQQDAARRQETLSREIYYDQRGLQQPYYQAGLQGLYGSSGVMNLLGMGGQQGAAPAVQQGGAAQSPNAFAQYASGSYGVAPVGQQGGPDWNAYLQANPDVLQSWSQAAQTPHVRNLGITTPEQWAKYHYETFGKSEGRQMGAQPQQPSVQQQPVGQPQLVDVGGGAMMQGGGGDQLAQLAPSATPQEGPMTQTLRQTPGYQFLQDESKRQVENSFASRGKLLSGGAISALNDRTLGIADQTYQQSVGNAFNLANLGMGAAAQIQGAGSQYGNSAGNAFANMGNAAAQGAYGKADAWNAGAQGIAGAVAGGIGMYGGYKGWGQNSAPSATTTGTFNGIGWGGTR